MEKIIIFLLLLFPGAVYGQQQGRFLVDSLRAELGQTHEDTTTVNILDQLSYTYSQIYPDSGIIFGKQALRLSAKLKWKKGIAVANADLGANYQEKSDYVAALRHNLAALDIYRTLKRKKSIAAMLSNIALVYHKLGNYPKALEYNLKALPVMEALGERSSESIILENIGTIYVEQKNYNKAEAYYAMAMKLNEAANDEVAIARNKTNMGIVYDGRGDYVRALGYHQAAYDINKKYDYRRAMQTSLANIGLVYYHMQEPGKALKYHLQALKISEETNNPAGIAINSGNIGAAYADIAKKKMNTNDQVYDAVITGNLDKAIQYTERAVHICNEIGLTAPKIEFMKGLAEVYYLAGDYKKAYDARLGYGTLRDSVYTIQAAMQIADLESKRKADINKKNLQISQLQVRQKQNEIILYILGIIVLLTILTLTIKSIVRYRKNNRILAEEKKKNRKTIHDQLLDIRKRQRALEEIAQVQSHDIRGQVTTILGLTQLFNTENYADPGNKIVIDGVISSAQELDNRVREVIEKKNRLGK